MKEYKIMMYLANQILWSNNESFLLVDNWSLELDERFL